MAFDVSPDTNSLTWVIPWILQAVFTKLAVNVEQVDDEHPLKNFARMSKEKAARYLMQSELEKEGICQDL